MNKFLPISLALSAMAILRSSEENTASGEATEAPPTPGLEAAPGTTKPEGAQDTARIPFPMLTACGGKFRSKATPTDASVHFDINLVPTVSAWPLSKDANGQDVKLPWDGHSRLKHYALTKECFDTEEAYFYYRMYEAHAKFMDAKQDYEDAKNGVERRKANADRTTQTMIKGLEAMAAELAAAMPGLDVQQLLQVIKARNAAAPAEAPAPAPAVA